MADLRPNLLLTVWIKHVGPFRLHTTPEGCDALHHRPVVFLLWLKTPKLHIKWILWKREFFWTLAFRAGAAARFVVCTFFTAEASLWIPAVMFDNLCQPQLMTSDTFSQSAAPLKAFWSLQYRDALPHSFQTHVPPSIKAHPTTPSLLFPVWRSFFRGSTSSHQVKETLGWTVWASASTISVQFICCWWSFLFRLQHNNYTSLIMALAARPCSNT